MVLKEGVGDWDVDFVPASPFVALVPAYQEHRLSLATVSTSGRPRAGPIFLRILIAARSASASCCASQSAHTSQFG